MKIILRIAITIIVIALLFAFGIIPIFSQMIIAKHSLPSVKSKITDLAEKRLEVLDDLEELSKHAYFAQSPWEKNFQPYIEKYIGFQTEDEIPNPSVQKILEIL